MTLFITPAHAQETPAAPVVVVVPEAGHGEATTTEVGHEAAGGGVFPPFDSSTFASQILWLAITFGLLYWVISRIAAPRIASILEVRRDRIAGDLAEAERMRGETDAAVAAYEQSLAEAKQKAGVIATETRERVNRDLEARRHGVEADLSTKLADAEAKIGAIKSAAMAEVDAIATETTEAIVNALIGQGTRDEAASAVSTVRKA